MNLTNFARLQTAIESMGIAILTADISRKLHGNMKIDLSDIICGNTGLYGLIERGDLLFVTKIILHIADFRTDILRSSYRDSAHVDFQRENYDAPELRRALHKYHLSHCETLQGMFANERRHRYKQSHRQDGRFHYTFVDNNEPILIRDNQRLNVCQNCLGWLNQRNASHYTVDDFSPAKFFDNVPNEEWLPDCGYPPDNTPYGGYPDDFYKIAAKVKEKRNYQCAQCGFVPDQQEDMRFLDCHHINADIGDNRIANLECLCVRCHAEQLMHKHIKESPRYKEFLPIWKEWHG